MLELVPEILPNRCHRLVGYPSEHLGPTNIGTSRQYLSWLPNARRHGLTSASLLVGLMQLGGICIAFEAAAHIHFISKWKKAETILSW